MEEDESEVEDEVTTDTNEVLLKVEEDGEEEITLPPHQRYPSRTLNLVSCTDIDRWLLSGPETKAIYRCATA